MNLNEEDKTKVWGRIKSRQGFEYYGSKRSADKSKLGTKLDREKRRRRRKLGLGLKGKEIRWEREEGRRRNVQGGNEPENEKLCSRSRLLFKAKQREREEIKKQKTTNIFCIFNFRKTN